MQRKPVKNREVVAVADLPGWPLVVLMCVYDVCGIGLVGPNLEILRIRGAIAKYAVETDLLFSAVADWNLEPEIVRQSGMPMRARLTPLFPDHPTCRSPTAARVYAYLLGSSAFANMVASIAKL